MTKRRLTEQEELYYHERARLIASCPPDYVADAPFLFATRIQATAMLTRIELFKMAATIPGAIVECGVHRGNALMLYLQLSLVLEPYAINRSLYGFDTFEGFRSITPGVDPDDVSEKTFADSNYALLEECIKLNDIVRPVNRISRCELIRGDIVKTVPEFVSSHPDLCVAMLILDTDLYEPTKVALQHFLPAMPKGGIVVLDEVCYRNFPGETRALREVLDLNDVELTRFPWDTSVGYFRV
jgi:hypothetical protein